MKKTKLSITLSEDLLSDIDKQRGLAPRSTYIEHLLKKIIKKK